MFSQVPIFADVLRPFLFPVQTNGATASVTISTAFGTNYGSVAMMPNAYFILTNFRCQTNYDNFGGAFSTATVTTPIAVSPAFAPNNFTVDITRGQNSRFSSSPLTQAQICSSGTLAGKQFPIPTIYGPRENFSFTFTDTTGLILLNASSAAISLVISMWMEGYICPMDQFGKLLNYFPGLKAIYPDN